MKLDSKFFRLLRQSNMARMLLPVGLILIVMGGMDFVFQSDTNKLISIGLIAAGVAALVGAVVSIRNLIAKEEKREQQDKSFKEEYHAPTPKTSELRKLYFQPDYVIPNAGFVVDDENRDVVYEFKMTKLNLLGKDTFEFVNHLENTSVTHEIGKTGTLSNDSSWFLSVLSTSSTFTYDGVDIWDYLHDQGIRISTSVKDTIIGFTYVISHNGYEIGEISTSSQYVHEEDAEQHKIMGKLDGVYGCYRIRTHEEDLDLLLLVAFAFARTEQVAYD